MMKWVLLAVVVVGVLWWLGRGRKGGSDGPKGADGSSRAAPPSGKAPGAPEAMVACAHCGVLLPKSDALEGTTDQRPYCSEAHRRAGSG
jgi:uncharacterized protein